MDIILLPVCGSNTTGNDSDSQNNETDPRLGKLTSLLKRLAELEEPFNIYAYLPGDSLALQSELIGYLITTSRDFGSQSVLVITPAAVRQGILDHPYISVIGETVIWFDKPGAGNWGPEEGKALREFIARLEEEPERVKVWIDGSGSSDVGPLIRSVPSLEELHIPLFTPGSRDERSQEGGIEAGNTGDNIFTPCRLFDNTLTVDADGTIIACPHHYGSASRMVTGRLSTDFPDTLLQKKGRYASSLGKWPRCRLCRQLGRFYWPENRNEAVYSLMNSHIPLQESGEENDSRPEPQPVPTAKDIGVNLHHWKKLAQKARGDALDGPAISVETPVIKGQWLIACIDSVLNQTSPNWHFSVLWDNGDELSRQILEQLHELDHPKVSVFFGEGLGIARARRFLTEKSGGDFILTLDDDDILAPTAVERFLKVSGERPWSGLIRARRGFIDEDGIPIDMEDWFPFGPRRYFRGMTRDLYNHSQPVLLSRNAYNLTSGWEGFKEYRYAGEDCDIVAKVEEVSQLDILPETLYYYRVNCSRTSNLLGSEAARDMWRRIAKKTLKRRGLSMELANREQPFTFNLVHDKPGIPDDIDFFVIDSQPGRENREKEAGTAPPALASLIALDIADNAIHPVPYENRNRLETLLGSASRRFVCFIRSDVTIPGQQTLTSFLEQFGRHLCDLACPKIHDSKGHIVCSDPYFDLHMVPRSRGFAEADRGQYDYCTETPWIPSIFMVAKREIFSAVHNLANFRLNGYLADADFCLRARERGFNCLYLGPVSVAREMQAAEVFSDEELSLFKRRWSSHRHLIDPRENTVSLKHLIQSRQAAPGNG